MAGVGFQGVEDYSNTTGASAVGVVASGDVGGAGVIATGGPPPQLFNLTTESGDLLTTESGNYIVVTN